MNHNNKTKAEQLQTRQNRTKNNTEQKKVVSNNFEFEDSEK